MASRRRGGRPLGGRPGTVRPGPGPRALWQAALGHAVSSPPSPWRAGLHHQPAPRHPDRQDPYLAKGPRPAPASISRTAPQGGGDPAHQPGPGQGAETLASEGPDAFYRGPLAEAMVVAKVRSHPTNPGVLAAADLASYSAKLRDGLCFDYRQSEVCGFPTPSSGTLASARSSACWRAGTWQRSNPCRADGRLAALERCHPPLQRGGAARLADPTSTWPTPTSSSRCRWPACWTKGYLAERGRLIGNRSMGWPSPASRPVRSPWPGCHPRAPVHQPCLHRRPGGDGGLHDQLHRGWLRLAADGQRLPAQQPAHGFLLHLGGCGRPAGGKPGRARQASALLHVPLLVFDKQSGEPEMSLGSPGARPSSTTWARRCWEPRTGGSTCSRPSRCRTSAAATAPPSWSRGTPDAVVQGLESQGHEILLGEQTSGLQVQRNAGGWLGAADPRREGIARGRLTALCARFADDGGGPPPSVPSAAG